MSLKEAVRNQRAKYERLKGTTTKGWQDGNYLEVSQTTWDKVLDGLHPSSSYTLPERPTTEEKGVWFDCVKNCLPDFIRAVHKEEYKARKEHNGRKREGTSESLPGEAFPYSL